MMMSLNFVNRDPENPLEIEDDVTGKPSVRHTFNWRAYTNSKIGPAKFKNTPSLAKTLFFLAGLQTEEYSV